MFRFLLVLLFALPALGQVGPEIGTLRAAAKKAARASEYCKATFFFEWTYDATKAPKELYNAAEVAFAADDRLRALRLYQLLRDKHRSFRKIDTVRERLRTLAAMLVDSVGITCEPPERPRSTTPVVSSPVCGDGIQQENEDCDDGNRKSGDGCDENCTKTTCGNGVVSTGETCDDGNREDGDGCDNNCTKTACGNGVISVGEACDDGNTTGGDGCNASCQREETAQSQSSVPGYVTAGLGASVLVVGVGAAIVGALPLVEHEDARTKIIALEQDAAGKSGEELAAILAEAAVEQERQRRSAQDFSDWGQYALYGGAGSAALGFLLTGAGITWALTAE